MLSPELGFGLEISEWYSDASMDLRIEVALSSDEIIDILCSGLDLLSAESLVVELTLEDMLGLDLFDCMIPRLSDVATELELELSVLVVVEELLATAELCVGLVW